MLRLLAALLFIAAFAAFSGVSENPYVVTLCVLLAAGVIYAVGAGIYGFYSAGRELGSVIETLGNQRVNERSRSWINRIRIGRQRLIGKIPPDGR